MLLRTNNAQFQFNMQIRFTPEYLCLPTVLANANYPSTLYNDVSKGKPIKALIKQDGKLPRTVLC